MTGVGPDCRDKGAPRRPPPDDDWEAEHETVRIRMPSDEELEAELRQHAEAGQ